MAVLAVAAAGAWAGSAAFGAGAVLWGMSGAHLGWMAGSMIGNALFAPTQKSQGPRLGDLQVSGSSYGTPIPWVAGHPRIAGQVVWASAKREIATTQSAGGKGGGGAEYTTYTYEVDLLILLTDNEIAGVSRIWSNGELIYSRLASAGLNSLAASVNTGAWARMTVYAGSSSQLPDPAYEAAVGTANAPAYRGRGSVFIQSLQLGAGGQIPNLTFEVYTAGVSGGPQVALLCRGAGLVNTTMVDESKYAAAATGTGIIFSGGRYDSAGYKLVANNSSRTFSGAHLVPSRQGWTLEFWVKPNTFSTNVMHRIVRIACANGYTGLNMAGPPSNWNRTFAIDDESFNVLYEDWPNGYTQYQWMHVAIVGKPTPTGSSSAYDVYRSGVKVASGSTSFWHPADPTSASITIGESVYATNGYDVDIDDIRFTNGLARYSANFTPPDKALTDDLTPMVTFIDATVQSVVSDLCLRGQGLALVQFDVSALSAITRPVRAMSNASVSTARAILEVMASTYQFEAVLSDKIYFKPRGSAPVATLTFDELGVMVDSTSPPDPLPLTQANELEIPAQLALTYSNIDGDYQTDTQYSDRLLTGMESTAAAQVPMGFTASEAKQIADTMLLDKAVSALSTTITLDTSRAALQPTDVILLTGEDASSYRMRIVKRIDAGGVTTLACVADDASILTQSGATSGGTASQTTVAALATTSMVLMDIPLLRDVDNLPGFYLGVTGSAANWTSCAVYDSLDDLTYSQALTMADQTALGTCTTALGSWTGGNVFDETNTVTVNVGAIQQLASVTRDDILTNTGINAALIGAELVQYRSATLVSAGVYTLSGFLRGRRGTEWAQTGHASGERFVALGTSGLRFVPLQSGDLGRLRYYKAASAGQKLSAVTAQPITPAGVALECFSPVNLRANRSTTDTALTWTRRTRLSTRLVGSLPINAPLGEVTEAYDVEVWDSSYTTLKRTISSNTPAATYTAADQVTDFGSTQAVLYLKIYQLSATVGRGYPLTASI